MPTPCEAHLLESGEDRMESLIENARLLKGIPYAELKRFSDILKLNPGTLELIGILKSMGFKIALLSSGFTFFTKRIFEEAGVDYAFSNTLEVGPRRDDHRQAAGSGDYAVRQRTSCSISLW